MNEQKETYKIKVYCKNCDFRNEIDIPKGQPFTETPCPNCGVIDLDKDIDIVTTSYRDFEDYI